MNKSETSLTPQEIELDLLPQKFSRSGKIWVGFLIVICVVGLYAYTKQLKYGLSVTGMGDYASWGIYISNFVFFVAISLVGSLITAILRLSDAKWSTPLTRISEIIAVSAIIFASLIIIIDMGRPDRMLNLFIYGRLQSPILWDVMVITTYLVLSLLLLYIPLIPDMAILMKYKDKFGNGTIKLFKWLGGFWQDTADQNRLLQMCVKVLSVTIIPVALAIHTVTSWLFATTYRAGWDSTNFGAYFVSGAFLVGAGGVIVAMYVFRTHYHLEKYITLEHFNKMGKLLVMLALVYLYFNINEYMMPLYKMKKTESEHLQGLFTGDYASLFWTVIILGMIVPIIILIFKSGRKPFPMFIVGILVVIGAWFKRFLIVTPTMLHPLLPKAESPERFYHYLPTWEEWAITLGSLAGALLLITIMVRFLPVVPIEETIRENNEIHKP